MIVLTKMSKYLLACLVLGALGVFAEGVDQSGFISIDCGASESSYIDQPDGLNYSSDAGFTDRVRSVQLLLSFQEYRPNLRSVRSFPEGIRNCYTLRPEKGKNNKYLIRAWFLYGNYDGLNQLPEFDVYIGEDFWATVSFQGRLRLREFEMIHTPTTNYVHVCLHKTGKTIPFISALELRPLENTTYQTQSGSLSRHTRRDYGADPANWVRYPVDARDRFWRDFINSDDIQKSPNTTNEIKENVFEVPSTVMKTAATPRSNSSNSLSYSWEPVNPSDEFYLYLHFAEVEDLKGNESRRQQIYLNGDEFEKEFSPPYLKAFTVFSTRPPPAQTQYELTINSTQNSTHPPIINALEIFVVKYFDNSATDDTDVAAIFDIKSYYGLTKNWTGDPCRSRAFIWEDLICDYDNNSSRIVALNLQSSQLTGSIAPPVANLTSIQILDLSNNSLNGSVPEFLGELANLKILNLTGNNFSGPVPEKLLEKSKQGSLTFSIDDPSNNAGLKNKNKNNAVLPIVASALAALFVVSCVMITLWAIRRRKRRVIVNKSGRLETKARQFTYSEVLQITNNFQKVVGQGGFGTVYQGLIGDTEVAVKMLSPSSSQGYKEFQSEANLLLSVHHKNLTSFLGYCNEGSHIGIIYEYMANGNLQQHLSELTWEQRLNIAVDAAQGLQYLHQGCRPPIIHRDIKLSNILLTNNFQAKLSDFGLSRAFPIEGGSHLSINTIAGTPGYVDPEYLTSLRLTKKSDVYSFGVVLLQIITGRPAIDSRNGNKHISDWMFPLLERGDMSRIVDERLKYYFNVNSAWKVVELAVSCVSESSITRPTMYDVVIELKECLAIATSNLETQPMTQPVGESECRPFAKMN